MNKENIIDQLESIQKFMKLVIPEGKELFNSEDGYNKTIELLFGDLKYKKIRKEDKKHHYLIYFPNFRLLEASIEFITNLSLEVYNEDISYTLLNLRDIFDSCLDFLSNYVEASDTKEDSSIVSLLWYNIITKQIKFAIDEIEGYEIS